MDKVEVLCVFVVLAASLVTASQEKIKHNKFHSNNIVSDDGFSNTQFDSSVFPFNPFTPFPELLNTTPMPTTRKQVGPVIRKATRKVAVKPKIHRKWNVGKKQKHSKDYLKTIGYKSGNNGNKSIVDSKTKSKVIKLYRNTAKQDNEEWVRSIFSRTTKRPKTTTVRTTTPPTTQGPVLTRELQLQLKKLLTRKRLPEITRSQYNPVATHLNPTVSNSQQTSDNVQSFKAQQQLNRLAPQHKFATKQQFSQKYKNQQKYHNTQPTSFVAQLAQSILKQQIAHEKFLEKNRFHLQDNHAQMNKYFQNEENLQFYKQKSSKSQNYNYNPQQKLGQQQQFGSTQQFNSQPYNQQYTPHQNYNQEEHYKKYQIAQQQQYFSNSRN